MLEVVLAGFTRDAGSSAGGPETIPAAYARISRDPRAVGELRRESASEVEKARRSNRRIVFEYGHSSVAEHAVFNLDVTGLSRLGAEYLQSFRLASFTEKSQRYIRLGQDFVVPAEVPSGSQAAFRDLVGGLFALYEEALGLVSSAGQGAEGGREDARYVLPLCTTCQMGMTANARELEHITRRLRAAPLAEVRSLGEAILGAVEPVAPSLFRHLEPTAMDRFAMAGVRSGPPADAPVALLSSCGDSAVGSFLACLEEGVPPREAPAAWERMPGDRKRALFEKALSGMGPHDQAPRCWELASFTFALVLSASAFAQMKRHRMCTVLPGPYRRDLGVTVPPSFSTRRLEDVMREACGISSGLSDLLGPEAVDYSMLNASRRQVLVSMNARELYHFTRLRCDAHAQWEIRSVAGAMKDLAAASAPLTMMLAGGKSDFRGGPG